MNSLHETLYEKMLLIRKSEQAIDKLFSQGVLRGTVHGCIGQEAIAAGVLSHVDPSFDFITGSHRSHGHYLSLSEDPKSLFCELMGKSNGAVKGRGGSQHIRYKNFFTNGITGGMVPVAVGLAYYQKINTNNGIAVSFFGDGAMNEGYVMEAFNLASIMKVPVLFVLENNGFAMSTSQSKTTAGSCEARVRSFDIEYTFIEANDAINIYRISEDIISRMRMARKPSFIEFKTHRFSGHSKSDKREYIDQELDLYWKMNDPLKKIGEAVGEAKASHIEALIERKISDAISEAIESPFPDPTEEYEGENEI